VLDRVQGNRAQAARLLGMTERSFYRLLRKYRRGANTSIPGDRDVDATESAKLAKK